jgi:hypothetical protein
MAQLVLFGLVGLFFGGALILGARAPEGQQWQPRVLGVAILVFAGIASAWAIRAHSRWSRGIHGSPSVPGPKTVRGVFLSLAVQIVVTVAFGILMAASTQRWWTYLIFFIVAVGSVIDAIRDARVSLNWLRNREDR